MAHSSPNMNWLTAEDQSIDQEDKRRVGLGGMYVVRTRSVLPELCAALDVGFFLFHFFFAPRP